MIERDLFCLFDSSLANNCPCCLYTEIVCIVWQIQTKQIQQQKYNNLFQVCMPVFYIWIRQAAIYLLSFLCFDSMNMLSFKRPCNWNWCIEKPQKPERRWRLYIYPPRDIYDATCLLDYLIKVTDKTFIILLHSCPGFTPKYTSCFFLFNLNLYFP